MRAEFDNVSSSSVAAENIFEQKPLDNLPSEKDAKIKTVAASFASIFVNEILQTARKTQLSEDSFLDSNQTGMAQKMYYEQVASSVSHDDSFGVTSMIEAELKK